MLPRVLIAIHSDTFFGELNRLALTLRQSGVFEPVLFFPHYYPIIDSHVEQCLKQNLQCLDHSGRLMISNTATGMHIIVKNRRAAGTLKKHLHRLRLLNTITKLVALKDLNHRNFDNVFFEIWYLRHRIGFIRKVLQRHKISLVVLGGDLVHYDTACFVRAAKMNAIRSVIVPCTMSNALEMAESYLPIRKYHLNKFPNNILGHYYPEWVYRHHGQALIRLPAEKMLAMKLLRLSPPHPWINLSGFADRIAVESEAMVKYYTREGIPSKQLVVTGTVSDDALAEGLHHADQRRSNLYRKYGVSGDLPMLLVSLPPDQLYMVGGRPNCDFSSHHELVEYWLTTLSQESGYTVIVNLHPSLPYERWRTRTRPGVIVVQENITELLPLCQFFVASVSTVIRWAIACSKPVINYDVYRFRYTDYEDESGVITVESRSDFNNTLHRLATDKSYFENLQRHQQSRARYWGRLDGLASDRMTALFRELLNGPSGIKIYD